MFQALCGEPWLYRPEEVGRLTDYQVWEILIRPAARKQRQWDREYGRRKARPGRPPKRKPNTDGRPDGVPTRKQYIAIGRQLGLTRKQAAAEYDRQMAAMDKNAPPTKAK